MIRIIYYHMAFLFTAIPVSEFAALRSTLYAISTCEPHDISRRYSYPTRNRAITTGPEPTFLTISSPPHLYYFRVVPCIPHNPSLCSSAAAVGRRSEGWGRYLR